MLKENDIEGIVNDMLEAYKPECRYLKSASIDYSQGRTTKGVFQIPSPFYCIGTGHFNAVELFICYNQLACVKLASLFVDGAIPSVRQMPVDEYKKNYQARRSFIARVNSLRFNDVMDPQNFKGEIRLNRARKVSNTVFIDTDFKFADYQKGSAQGNMLIAVSFDEDKSQSENLERAVAIA